MTIGYQGMTAIDEMDTVPRLTTLLANPLGNIVGNVDGKPVFVFRAVCRSPAVLGMPPQFAAGLLFPRGERDELDYLVSAVWFGEQKRQIQGFGTIPPKGRRL